MEETKLLPWATLNSFKHEINLNKNFSFYLTTNTLRLHYKYNHQTVKVVFLLRIITNI
jgi:hypothetical protein